MHKLFLLLFFALSIPNVPLWSETEDEIQAYKDALSNYRSIYNEIISNYLKKPYSGFNHKYQLGLKEKTLYSDMTEQKVELYAKLCSLVYTKERADFEKIKQEVENGIRNLDLGGEYKLIGVIKRNLRTTPALSAILLYSSKKNHIILAFKGTVDKDNYDDWKKNLNFLKYSGSDKFKALEAPDGTKLSVHRGFAVAYLEGLDDFVPQFNSFLSEYAKDIQRNIDQEKKPLKIVVTGHSLGGALSLIAANDMRRIIRTSGLIKDPSKIEVGNISFASPRVYDSKSAKIVEKQMGGKHNILRFVDPDDLVPTVPFTVLDADHAGISFYLGKKTVYTFSLDSHAMKNYLAKSPKVFKEIKDDADYLRFVLDSINYYKNKLNDTSAEPFEIYDSINNIKINIQQNDAAISYWTGKIHEEKDKEELMQIQTYLQEINQNQKILKESLIKEENKLKELNKKSKSWYWPF